MHATNEQMAEIMGWHRAEGGPILYTDDGHYTNFALWGFKYQWTWNPVENLNHAALVEARLIELRNTLKWRFRNQYIDNLYELLGITDDMSEYTKAWTAANASAQTRCDAAWATWQAWKEQAK